MTSKKSVELAVSAAAIIPVVPRERIFNDCSLVIDDGAIVDILPTSDLLNRYQPARHEQLSDRVLLPGLINCHGHAAMSLFRGYADDLPLMTWLQEHIWPAEGDWVSEEFVHDGARLAMAEMLLAGTTCFSDMYFYPEATAAAAFDTGMRAQVNFPILDFPTMWGSGPEDYIHKGLNLHDNYRSVDLISVGFGPHAPYTVSDEPLKRVATLAEETQAPIQIHMHETAFEVETSLKEHHRRPLARVAELGLLGPATQLVHMTQVDDSDIELVSTYGAQVIHCPDSNLKLASGFCPVQQLLDAGINVALGTDGAASNNDLSLFGEMHTAALLGKGVAGRADAMGAAQMLEMATLSGARALGLEQTVGSLEKGKRADFIALNLNQIEQLPRYSLLSQLVYTHVSHLVSHVWVDGKCLVRERELQTLDLQDVRRRAQQWQAKISG